MSYDYKRVSSSLRSFALATIFQNYLLFLALKLAKIAGKNRPMSFSEVYFIQSFREYLPRSPVSAAGDGRYDRLEGWVGATIIIVINVSFPTNFIW